MNPQPLLLLNQALQYLRNNNPNSAALLVKQALKLDPKNVDALRLFGVVLAQKHQHIEALNYFQKALKLDPKNGLVFSNIGNTLQELKRYEEALVAYDQAISLLPNYAEAYSNRGNALHELKRYQQALLSHRQAIAIEPNYAEAYSNLGNTLQKLKLHEEALIAYDNAISVNPRFSEAWCNKGFTLSELKRYNEALSAYDLAINLDPQNSEAYWNKSLAELVTGKLLSGWKNYEFRWKKRGAESYKHAEIPSLTSLNNIAGKKILVWSEQGYGDTIQFCRFIEKLSALNAEVIFEVQPPLTTLLSNSLLGCNVISEGTQHGDIDFAVPLLSLPLIFSIGPDNIPTKNAYLAGNKGKSDHWRDLLKLDKSQLNIGIACSGNEIHKSDLDRSIDLELFEPLTKFANLFLIQKKLRPKDLNYLEKSTRIHYLGDKIQDFSDSAAIVDEMDAIVSVDTSLAHLSGALGRPTFILVHWNPEWRWLLDRQNSPWYPTIKIIRQNFPGNWASTIEEVISCMRQKTSFLFYP